MYSRHHNLLLPRLPLLSCLLPCADAHASSVSLSLYEHACTEKRERIHSTCEHSTCRNPASGDSSHQETDPKLALGCL